MYIHVFAFRWKPSATAAEQDRAMQAVARLKEQIPEVLEAHVGLNVSPLAQGYTFGGVMKFADKQAFETYSAHPVHQALLAEFIHLIEPIELDIEAR